VTAKDTTVGYGYPTTTSTATTSTQPHTLTGMSSTYTTDAGAQVTEAAGLTYDAAGNTKTRTYGGDTQNINWTWDGKARGQRHRAHPVPRRRHRLHGLHRYLGSRCVLRRSD
jgi:hypothetical protein